MADRDIPLHVFHFDCYWMEAYEWCNFTWDPKTFPDPEGMLRRYHDRGLKICVWINPYIGQKSPLFEEGMRLGYLMKKTNGDVGQTDMWQMERAYGRLITGRPEWDWWISQIPAQWNGIRQS